MMNKNNTIIVIAIIVLLGVIYFFTMDIKRDEMMSEEHHGDEMGDEMVESYEIYPGVVADKIGNGEDIILLDVRTLEEYTEVHLKNSILLPVQELSQKSLTEVGLGEGYKNKEIIIYCRSGTRSKTAYDIMNSLGYTNIKSVAGGMIHWEEDNYPFTETGEYEGSYIINKSSEKALSNGSRIVIDRTFHDFGIIPQFGGIVETTFTIKNNGTEILTIGDITTSCGCASSVVESKSILAGEKTTLTVYFDPDFHEEPVGVFKRTIFIPTNDPTNQEAEIVIQVDIEEGK